MHTGARARLPAGAAAMSDEPRVDLELGHEHYGRWLGYPKQQRYITKVRDMAAWDAGDRSAKNQRKVPLVGCPTLLDGTRVNGLIIRHRSLGQNRHNLPGRAAAGEWCEGVVVFWEPEPSGGTVWTLHSVEPLHIEPSVLCNCGDHGFIRDGRWVPA